MLEPRDRMLLLDHLRPPVGYTLDFAIGTTFSLDLVALLGAPLAFALLDRADRDGRLVADPVALVEALRRNADKFVVFCQAGQIAVPPPERTLLTMLEANVIEVSPKSGGLFHPKVWALRFVSGSGDVYYRLLCGTRNLTFDRSWDTMLVLEGPLRTRKAGFGAHRPLGEFFAALPGMAVYPVSQGITDRVEQVQTEIRKADFEAPEPFESYAFVPIGHDGKKAWPFATRMDRLVIFSPFVADSFLTRVLKDAGGVRLISRSDQLDCLDQQTVSKLSQVDVFDDEQIDEIAEEEEEREAQEAGMPAALTGLHAKLYVADVGWDALVWTGSANATNAAFNQNVEFLVELEGKKSRCGIDALLKLEQGEPGIASFLKPWAPRSAPPTQDDSLRVLEERCERQQRALAGAGLMVAYRVSDSGGGWSAVVSARTPEALAMEAGVTFSMWPITCRPEAVSRPLDLATPAALATFDNLSSDALTSFLALRIEVTDGDKRLPPRDFTLNALATGLPDDRHLQLLLKIVGNRDVFEDYLRMLLAGVEAGGDGESLGALVGLGAGEGSVFRPEQPLFEMLVRALHQDPARVDDVGRLVAEIEKSGKAREVYPAGFGDLWPVIEEARKSLSNEVQPPT